MESPPLNISDRLTVVHGRIVAAGGNPNDLTIVAATKRHGMSSLLEACDAGITEFGENYFDELAEKATAMAQLRPGQVHWHAIGGVQRRHVARVASHVSLWHGIDRVEEGVAIAAATPGAGVLAQVNLTNEPGKGGVAEWDLPALLDDLRGLGLELRGLMTMGPGGDPELARPAFRRLRSLADVHGLRETSMGMSGDLEVAVQEGATILRIGTALLGLRTYDASA